MTTQSQPSPFALIHLGSVNGVIELGKPPASVSIEILLQDQHLLIFAERGHKQEDFLNWIRPSKQWNSQQKSWVELDLSCGEINASNQENELFQQLRFDQATENPEAFFKALESNYNVPEIAANKQKKSNSPVQIRRNLFITKNFPVEPPQQAVRFATGLRRFAERHIQPTSMNFIGINASYRPFSDQPDSSGYGAYCQRYRLANLDMAAVLERPEFQSLDNTDSTDRETLYLVMAHTGGHPLLVEQLGRHLRDAGHARRRFGVSEVEEAMRRMRNTLPSACAAWLEHLRRAVKEQPNLIYPLEAYLKGETLGPFRFPPPASELELHLSGWVGLDTDGHWGISSRFHLFLASQVMSELR